PVLLMLMLIAALTIRPTGLLGVGEDEGRLARANIDDIGERRIGRDRTWLTAGLLLLVAAYPLIDIIFGLHHQLVATHMLLFMMLALGLNIVLGFAGLLDMGYAACFALGGYTVAMLT